MSIANTQSETIFEAGIVESNDQTEARVENLKQIETLVGNSYPNKYERSKISGAEDTISNVLSFAPVAEIAKELKDATPQGEKPNQELKESLNQKLKAFGSVRISGRLAVPPRVMGKAAFVHLSDGKNRLQIYVRKQDALAVSNDTGKTIDEEGKAWELFGLLDHGDFVGVSGYLFLTNTGELSVHVETIQFLSKALLPMPDKMHGIADAEISRRYRYADLIASSLRNRTEEEIEEEKRTGIKQLTTREVFERRAKLITGMRRFLDDAGFIEVETPMLTPKATGAAAEPFETFHKALGIPLYARIAPELYLKRLMVGGFEKVYELNRNFRNEGLSHKHSPEFTMLEFYVAYMDVNGMMDFAEAMIKDVVMKANDGSLIVKYGENEIDFEKPFERLSMKEAITKYIPEEWRKFGDELSENTKLDNLTILNLTDFHKALFAKAQIDESTGQLKVGEIGQNIWNDIKSSNEEIEEDEIETGKSTEFLFETFVESKLIQPTFIIDYPKSLSPLSKASPENPQIAERFELFINGAERANGFSELNDPQEQMERFRDQMNERESGDAEAMVMDEDYIRALAYGMPPAAGIGIGIDRLVMLLTNRHSIRDVILFPHMRPERKAHEESEASAPGDSEITK